MDMSNGVRTLSLLLRYSRMHNLYDADGTGSVDITEPASNQSAAKMYRNPSTMLYSVMYKVMSLYMPVCTELNFSWEPLFMYNT